MKEFITIGYSYNELSEEAKENVKRWYLDDELRSQFFYEDTIERLKEAFPRSSLDVGFRLSYCQGDGLNIYGEINLFDFLKHWDASEKAKRTMEFYIEKSGLTAYTFTANARYGYSCKHLDKKEVPYLTRELMETLDFQQIRDVNEALIEEFYTDLFNHFSELDSEYEGKGYDYLYDCDEEEIWDYCEANDYYFTEKGDFIA